MDNFLYWYSQNNKIIIQLLSVFIGLILVYLIYRLFFVNDDVTDDIEVHRSVESAFLNQSQKNHQNVEIEIRSQGDLAQEVNHVQGEFEKIKQELEISIKQLNEKKEELSVIKNEITSQKEEQQKNKTNYFDSNLKQDEVQSHYSGDAALIAKIDELQKKLNEYDIISDDIAELQSLRAENAELRSKIQVG